MKRIISILLAVMMITGVIGGLSVISSATTAATPYSIGDVSGDGYITAKDSLLLKKYLACLVDFNVSQETAGDINRDNVITSKDRSYLTAYLVCKINSFDATDLATMNVSRDRTVKIGGVDFNASNYCIVLPENMRTPGVAANCGYDDPDNFHLAARRMKGFLPSITGESLNILFDTDTSHLANYPHKIYCVAGSDAVYGEEGFNISTSNGDVYLTATGDPNNLRYGRGMFYCVYTFMEEYLDCRFFPDYGLYVPYRSGAISIPNGINRTENPVFSYRCSAGASMSQSDEPDWQMTSRKINSADCNGAVNRARYGYGLATERYHAHSFASYLGDYLNLEPYKSNHNAVFCLSNSTNRTNMVTAVNMLINERISWGNHLTQISCSIEDHISFCTCSTCKAKYIQYGCINGLYIEFVNVVAADLAVNHPDLKTYSILYDHTVPTGINTLPNEIWCYCGTGCNNHTIKGGVNGNSDNCDPNNPGYVMNMLGNGGRHTFTQNGQTYTYAILNDGVNTYDKTRLANFASYLHGNGSDFYFWYYPSNYHYFMCPSPTYTNVYYDIKYLASIGVDGIYAEGDSHGYAFESLREYLAAEMLWNPNMSYAQFEEYMDLFLEAHCGDGWRYIREYIKMNEVAGDAMPCWTNNADAPWEMVSRSYYRTHYDEMSELFDKAYALTNDEDQQKYILDARVHCDFLGISAQFGGGRSLSSAQRTRYANMLSYMKSHDIEMSSSLSYSYPSSVNYNQDPMKWYDVYAGSSTPGANRPGDYN